MHTYASVVKWLDINFFYILHNFHYEYHGNILSFFDFSLQVLLEYDFSL